MHISIFERSRSVQHKNNEIKINLWFYCLIMVMVGMGKIFSVKYLICHYLLNYCSYHYY